MSSATRGYTAAERKQFLERLAAWHSCTADMERDQSLRQFHRDAAAILRESVVDHVEAGELPRVGVCTGSVARPHLTIEWWGQYTSCTRCHQQLRLMTAEDINRFHARRPPAGWPNGMIGRGGR